MIEDELAETIRQLQVKIESLQHKITYTSDMACDAIEELAETATSEEKRVILQAFRTKKVTYRRKLSLAQAHLQNVLKLRQSTAVEQQNASSVKSDIAYSDQSSVERMRQAFMESLNQNDEDAPPKDLE